LNRIRKLADDLVAKHPDLFSPNFDSNKKALSSVATIRSTHVRNQLAGMITTIMRERAPPPSQAANIPKEEEDAPADIEPSHDTSEKETEITQAAV
jgi:ribosomal protein S17E